jgi:hypothetical protein
LHYFDGLFLRASDFDVEQAFHLATRRYVNYLLFNAGRLHTADAAQPLTLSVVSGTTIRVSRGAALIRDTVGEAGHEVHLTADQDFNLANYGFNPAVDVALQARIDFEEIQDLVAAGAGGGVLVAGNNRYLEQAVIRFLETPAPAGHRSVLLGTLTLRVGTATISNLVNTTERGGVRYEILSSDLLSRIGGPGPGPVTLVSIAVTGAASVNVGATASLVATGTFSDASTRALGVGDGLVWSSSGAAATVNTAGVVTGVLAGAATITAAASGVTSTRTISVVSVITPNLVAISPPAATGQIVGGVVDLFGTQLRDPLLGANVPAVGTTVRLEGPGGTIALAASVTTRANSGANQVVRFVMPARAAGWSPTQAVTVRLEFSGGASTLAYRYDN